MSHYSVLVVTKPGQSVEDVLAPFDENMEADPYHAYIDPPEGAWWLGMANAAKFNALMEIGGMERSEAWKAVWGERNDDSRLDWPRSAAAEAGVNPCDNRAVAEWANAEWGNDDGAGEDEYHVDEGGLYRISTYNPNSKWDWYQIGGRWAGELVVKPEATSAARGEQSWGWRESGENAYRKLGLDSYDSAAKGDIDFERMDQVLAERAGAEYDKSKAEGTWHDINYGRRTREEAVAEFGLFSTYATLTHEGEWVEPGRMGWFGMSTETDDSKAEYRAWFAKYLEEIPDEYVLTVVDVHI